MENPEKSEISETFETFTKFHPGKRQEELYTLKKASPLDVVKAVQTCRGIEKKWEKVSYEAKVDIFLKVARSLEEKAEKLAWEEARQQGIALDFVKEHSVLAAAKAFRFWASAEALPSSSVEALPSSSPSPDFAGGRSVGGANLSVSFQPLSVVALCPAWPLCLKLLADRLAPALMAGNTCIVKTPSKSPASGERLLEILLECGLPEGVCSLLHGSGKELLPLLARHPAIRGLSFVGRGEVGQSLLKYMDPCQKRVQMAMEAKNGALVLEDVVEDGVEDAALEKCARELARACFVGQGQMCWNIHRVFVVKKVYSPFKEAFTEAVKALSSGYVEENSKYEVGPLIDSKTFMRTQKVLEQMKAEGGKVLVGGGTANVEGGENFFLPTVIENLSLCSPLQMESLPLPLVTLQEVKYAREGLRWINTSEYGVAAQIFTQDLERGKKLAQQLQVACVWLNTWVKGGEREDYFKASSFGGHGVEAQKLFFWNRQGVYT